MNIIVISLKEEFYSHADALVKFESFSLLFISSFTPAVYPHLVDFIGKLNFCY